MSWEMTPEEQEQWEKWVQDVREHTVKGMAKSAFVLQLVPRNEPDIKFAVELGLSILMDKPILAVVQPGASISSKLARIADRVVEVDVDTTEGQITLMAALNEFQENL